MSSSRLPTEIAGEIWLGSEIDETLHALTDVIGKRWIGTPGEEAAASWLAGQMTHYGFEQVHMEKVPMLGWKRGTFDLELREPFRRRLDGFALPKVGSHDVEADVVFAAFNTTEEWGTIEGEVQGRIVACTGGASKGTGLYGLKRGHKARLALDADAVGFLWCGTFDGQLPGTGSMDPFVGKAIPCAAISKEDALMLRRTRARGPVTLRLTTDNTFVPVVGSNVSGEIPGDASSELVVGIAHFDGHDIADAAHDNAAGVGIILEAARAIAKHGALKRSIRVVFVTAEEIGCAGSAAYVRTHAGELDRIRFVLNADGIGYLPSRLHLNVPLGGDLVPFLRQLFSDNGQDVVVEHVRGLGGLFWSDHGPFAVEGVPSGSFTVWQEACMHAHWGHTAADTTDKLSRDELRRSALCAALILHRAATADDWPGKRLEAADVRTQSGCSADEIRRKRADWDLLLSPDAPLTSERGDEI